MSNNADMLTLNAPATSTGGEITLLESGAYPAVCAGVTVRQMHKYQSDELEPKVQFVFQIVDGSVNHYLRTVPIRIVNNDGGNLNKLLASWLRMDAQSLTGFNLGSVVGAKAQVVVDQEIKQDKTYNVITNVLAPRKDQANTLVPDTLPEYLTRGAAQFVLAQGITAGTPSATVAAQPAPAAAPMQAKVEADAAEDLPF